MQEGEPAIVDQRQRVLEHGLALGGKAGDEVGAEHHIGAKLAYLLAEADRVRPRVTPLHALQRKVVACLEREMQMRHQPLLLGDGLEQRGIGLDRIDRGEPQPLELRHQRENLGTSLPSVISPGRSAP